MTPERFTYGYELELGDVDRRREIPEHLGRWEYAETDIVNLHGEYAGVACDPQGTDPPMGGEINIRPATSVMELADRVYETICWFRQEGDDPTASCVNHGHVHIHIPQLREDIAALKRITVAIQNHQNEIIRRCYQYEEHPDMALVKTARTYLKWDGGRPMPAWMAVNIVERANNFDDFIRIQCCGKDGVSRGRPFRYTVNTYCLKHIDTIELRCFRASLNYHEIWSSIDFARIFFTRALAGDDIDIAQIIKDNDYVLPPFVYNPSHYHGWETTKWDKSRGEKRREYVEAEPN